MKANMKVALKLNSELSLKQTQGEYGITNDKSKALMVILMSCAGHVRQSFAPKLASAEAMSAAMVSLPLRATVLFSSTAALFGAPGQGNYAAANAALEAWAARRAATGQQAVAVQWGAWAAGASLSAKTP